MIESTKNVHHDPLAYPIGQVVIVGQDVDGLISVLIHYVLVADYYGGIGRINSFDIHFWNRLLALGLWLLLGQLRESYSIDYRLHKNPIAVEPSNHRSLLPILRIIFPLKLLKLLIRKLPNL